MRQWGYSPRIWTQIIMTISDFDYAMENDRILVNNELEKHVEVALA